MCENSVCKVKSLVPTSSEEQAMFVLASAAPPPQPLLPLQPQPSSQSADLYALTLSDGSVVHFKIENNVNAMQGASKSWKL